MIMLQITTPCILLLITINFYFFLFLASGLKCELKGLLDNRIQCLLHDRGINTKDRNGSLLRDEDNEKSEPWRYSTGLDRDRNFFQGQSGSDFKKHVREVLGSTRWCGDIDNIQLSYEDLVFFVKTDKCCKQHDQCNSTMEVRETKNELINNGLMKRFHCDCEKEFLGCLKGVNKTWANKIGFTYFTVFGPQCFREDNPIVNCTKSKANRCLKYWYNRTEEKKYQWFDVPTY